MIRLGAVVFNQLNVRSLFINLVLINGQRLIDVDRDFAYLTQSDFTAFITSRPSFIRPRFLMMGIMRFFSGTWG